MIEPVYLDFETYSQVDLKKVGSRRYAEDPSTEVLCMAYAIGDESSTLWTPGYPSPRRLFDHVARGAEVHAWNAEFEISIWELVCSDQRCWPAIPLNQWRDSQTLALSFALPASLEQCGEVLELDVQKDRRGHHVMMKLSKPRRPSKHNPATRWTPKMVPKDFADLYAYCARDVEAERAIHQALPAFDLEPDELDLWRMTVEMNLRGWTIDLDSVDRMLVLLEEHGRRADAETKKLTAGAVKSGRQVAKTREWLLKNGVRMDDLKADTVDEVLRKDEGPIEPWDRMPPKCRRVLEIRREVAKASVKKYQSMRNRVCKDGTVKNLIKHHGARTGRDAGRGNQIQNYPRLMISKSQKGVEAALRLLQGEDPFGAVKIIHGSIPHFASALLRPMLTASPGTSLFAADFSQIENRIAVWYAGCEYGIQVFKDSLDEYVTFASKFYGVPYNQVTEDQRFHCKHAVLGCQFGMGTGGLVNQAIRFGHPIEREFAKELVDEYRSLYSEVVETWYHLDRAAKRAIETGERSAFDLVEFEVEGEFLMATLASGRRLAYHRPKVEEKETPWGELRATITHGGFLGQTKKWVRMKLIPGRLFENVVQATARDVMMHGARATEAAGYDLVGRVHDELISERDGGSAEEYTSLMKAPPPWLQGIPIEAEGWSGRRYRKG